jgi:peptidoglycan/xylan/chitin deacetylase (PgdA/CDA1 family)
MKIQIKISAIILSACFLIAGSLVYFLIYKGESTIQPLKDDQISWRIKELEEKSRNMALPILLYHNIDGKGAFSLDFDILKYQFEFLKQNKISVIKLAEFIQKLENPLPFKERTVAITFDDGFYSMHSRLLPLSNEFNYPITLFVYTNNIYQKAQKSLTWENLKELDSKNIDIECHSLSHPDLPELYNENTTESKTRLFEEIYLSKRIMELYLKKRVLYFAFPYGRYNLALLRLCQYAGYERVFSTDYGSNIITRNNYCLRRRHIKRDYPFTVIEKIVE